MAVSRRENLPLATFVDASQVLEDAMNEVSRSSEEELQMLRKACEILDLSFEAVIDVFKPGVSECELWAAAEYAILKNGGWYPHNMFITSSPEPLFPRGPASHRRLNPGDIVIFEINVTYGGVSPQIAYALSLGPPKMEVKEMFDFCERLYNIALAELEKRRTFADIELELARLIHEEHGEPMTPQMHIYNMAIAMPMNELPQPGDYFTVHPNLCDRKYTRGAKIGDSVRIMVDGKVERLQKVPVKLHIVQI
jgi:Xaa-Pro dipeptidase